MLCKNHVKKQYKGIQIDVYHGMNGAWDAYIPNRVKFEYKTADMKTKDMAIQDCKKYIDKKDLIREGCAKRGDLVDRDGFLWEGDRRFA